MSSSKPRVSIGLPVFNGEEYIEEALNSILAQTYSDFELIISDNASTDNTQQICLSYAAQDSRIRYYRNKRNLGASRNFNRVFELSSGEYFKWASHDDVLAPEFLARCISALDQDPSIVLCHSKTGLIDEHGTLVGTDDNKPRIDSRKPHERFGHQISICYPTWAIFGVIRATALRMTPLIGSYIGADKNLLAEISLIGRIYEIPEYLFFHRDHPRAYTDTYYSGRRVFPSYQEELAWWRGAEQIGFPYSTGTRICLEYFRSVRRVPLKWSDRQLCYAQIVGWFIKEWWMWTGMDMQKILLQRSSLGRKLALTVNRILRRTGILISEKEG